MDLHILYVDLINLTETISTLVKTQSSMLFRKRKLQPFSSSGDHMDVIPVPGSAEAIYLALWPICLVTPSYDDLLFIFNVNE